MYEGSSRDDWYYHYRDLKDPDTITIVIFKRPIVGRYWMLQNYLSEMTQIHLENGTDNNLEQITLKLGSWEWHLSNCLITDVN